MNTDAIVINWADEAEWLCAAVADDADWYASVARELARPGDRLAVDVGCGGAGMAVALGAVLPPAAFVVGVDGDGNVLDAARRRIVETGVDDGHIRLLHADLDTDLAVLPLVAGSADIIWASSSIHHLADQQAAIDALAALLAPGGRLALAEGGLPARHLPWDVGVGEPGLEVRLAAAEDRWYARMRASVPGSVPMSYGWPTALRRAGLADVTTKTFTLERPVPLCEADLRSVLLSLRHRVDRAYADGELRQADKAAWDRLLDPDDAAWLGRRDDVYSLSARSVHIGHRAAV
ncbi:class I SAM-dependent methyltransferase [Jiangella rhizosphaerae]|uniref:Class I SAM-dependent methyltransferase n=1 Tax=Jiangella rhizosphaerae TaxID=2293569 RepID=A0A418KVJ7_9ACTN|nr:class I SAM-dependent methyltransferase [Jiangella rhizosphaerae]RIQ32546.1 class I SAM-dependent methyltransferase [Jiangella rhizosphaerae]